MDMSDIWNRNIRACRAVVENNLGPRVVNIVSGSLSDQVYWQERLTYTRQDVFRVDGGTTIISSLEKTRKGNFLGSINAWIEIQHAIKGQIFPPMMLMTMVFGQGKRLSPFTQALANRKPAFPTPRCSSNQGYYLSTADIAAMSATLWQHHLGSNGFNGLIIKWGDEAVIPGKTWENGSSIFKDLDGMRFIWQTEPTDDLAREKEWVEFDGETSRMTFQYTRQSLDSLHQRLSQRGKDRCIGVNLGSLGISYALMRVMEEVFSRDVADENKWVDWDPYTWIALACKDESEWNAEKSLEERIGKTGIRELEKRIPEFYFKIRQVNEIFQERYGRLPQIGVLDFGEPYWMDWGLHLSMRRSLELLTTNSAVSMASRELFNLPQEPDLNGNIILGSSIPHGADIHNSLLVDTIITDPESVVHGGVVVSGKHRKLLMPHGGSALFCAADEMIFTGPHAIAFRATGRELRLAEGDRLAHLYLSDGTLEMRANESLVNYEGENYSMPVMGNPVSFAEAARRMSLEDTRLVENRWLEQWSSWLK